MEKKTLLKHLNEDLAAELGAIIQYLTYAAKATGPYRPQLAQFFLAEVADEQLHAQYLANKIVAMGGEPVTVPRPVPVRVRRIRRPRRLPMAPGARTSAAPGPAVVTRGRSARRRHSAG